MKNKNAFTWIELIVVIVIIAVLTAILFPAIRATRTGNSRLPQKPDEANRIYHPNGMSIIRPSDWIQEKAYDSPNHQELAFWAGSLRYPCKIRVISEAIKETSEETIDDNSIPIQVKNICNTEDSFKKILFQNEPAFEFVIQTHHSGGWEDPSYVRGGICFFHAQKCYLLQYQYFFFSKEIKVPENLRLYLESFRPPNADTSEKTINEQ
ncbi:MAG: prepilin-type N-terminal cleavage/methylation domain-containing protein [Planctomycetaceae bacterium]|jgi:prepilin-type N-terminal cleavage/methylation domain-containing protein|nr:prepilin-type N-terminal cleavage/methylation domain-containing protein [Planctomycetaceae bacterium]